MGPDLFLCTKGMYVKFLVWFFNAMKMKIISKISSSIFEVKINNFNNFFEFVPPDYNVWLKMLNLTPTIVENIF